MCKYYKFVFKSWSRYNEYIQGTQTVENKKTEIEEGVNGSVHLCL